MEHREEGVVCVDGMFFFQIFLNSSVFQLAQILALSLEDPKPLIVLNCVEKNIRKIEKTAKTFDTTMTMCYASGNKCCRGYIYSFYDHKIYAGI